MTNPFHIDGPAVVSFSGGRTSGLMLYRILDAWGGQPQESAAAERLGPSSTGARFRLDHPNTATIARMASQRRLPIFDPDDNDAVPCACTD